MNTLKKRLLSLGGVAVNAGLDTPEEIKRLLSAGKLWNQPVLFEKGYSPGRCHANIADMYLHKRRVGLKIVTGYALADEGVWYEHSWGIEDGKLVETTGNRYSMYFGYRLTKKEADDFCFYNY